MTGKTTSWFILLVDDERHVLPRAETFRDPGRAERAQARHPGSRLREIRTPALA